MLLDVIQKRKSILVIVAVLVLLALGYITFLEKSQKGMVEVSIKTVPSDASITIDGKGYKNGNFYFKPGLYNIEIKKTGFTTYSRESYFDEARRSVIVSMSAESSEAKEWVKQHQSEYNEIQAIGERDAMSGSGVTEKNPIIKQLPYRTFIYTIGYMGDQSDPSGNSIILTIHASEGYRTAALYGIRKLGYDPTDFDVVFKDYENPFPL